MATLSKGGEEAGYGTSALLESTAEFVTGELRKGSGELEAKPSDFVPLRIRDTLASTRLLLIVSGDWSNS